MSGKIAPATDANCVTYAESKSENYSAPPPFMMVPSIQDGYVAPNGMDVTNQPIAPIYYYPNMSQQNGYYNNPQANQLAPPPGSHNTMPPQTTNGPYIGQTYVVPAYTQYAMPLAGCAGSNFCFHCQKPGVMSERYNAAGLGMIITACVVSFPLGLFFLFFLSRIKIYTCVQCGQVKRQSLTAVIVCFVIAMIVALISYVLTILLIKQLMRPIYYYG